MDSQPESGPALEDAGNSRKKQTRLAAGLTILAVLSAIVEIRAQYFGPRTIVYIFKPLTMMVIIAIAVTIEGRRRSGYRNLIVVALVCSLAGDVFLMLPSDQFLRGLVSFAIAHIFYIAAFRTTRHGWPAVWRLVACAAYGCFMFWLLFPHLGEMKLPVAIYLVVILAMLWQALNAWATKARDGAGLAALGAALFVASDSLIALNRFYVRFHMADLLILATYFTAQTLIALSTKSAQIKSIETARG